MKLCTYIIEYLKSERVAYLHLSEVSFLAILWGIAFQQKLLYIYLCVPRQTDNSGKKPTYAFNLCKQCNTYIQRKLSKQKLQKLTTTHHLHKSFKQTEETNTITTNQDPQPHQHQAVTRKTKIYERKLRRKNKMIEKWSYFFLKKST